MRQTLYILTLLLLHFACYSQVSDVEDQRSLDSKGIVYKYEKSFDFRLHTNGYAFAYNWGENITYYKSNFYQIELGRLYDPRESSQNRNLAYLFNSISSSFKFGKQNDVFAVRLSKGFKKQITDKARRRGVTIGYNYSFGPAVAIIKPYYLELISQREEAGRTVFDITPEKYTAESADRFLNENLIYGGGGWTKGLNEVSFAPGITGKYGVFFDVGEYDNLIKTIEAGIMADFYLRKIPIMVETEAIGNKPYFINLYVNLQIGKRKN